MWLTTRPAACLPLLLAGLLAATPVMAADNALTVEQPWTRATIAGQRTGAVYLTLRNAGPSADRLTAARTPAARVAELHRHSVDSNGVARMRAVPSVDVPADGRAEFRPGGLHIMLVDLAEPLAPGASLPLTLVFEQAGEIRLTVPVLAATALGPAGAAPVPAPSSPDETPAVPDPGHADHHQH